MNQNKKPVENEYRSSQMYKTLTGAGIPAADELAKGLGKAAAVLDQALNTVGPAVRSAAQSVQEAQHMYVQHPQVPNQQVPRQQEAAKRAAQQNDGSYRYTYRYQGKSTPTGQTNPQTAQTRPPQAGQPGQPGQPGPTGQPAWGRNTTVRPPKGVTPAPAPKMPQVSPTFRANPGPPMKMVRKGSPAKYYITGIVALLYALNAPMTEPANFAVYAIVVVLTFLLSRAIFKGKKQFVPIEEPKPEPKPQPESKKEPEPEKKSRTGNPEVDKIIDEGHGYLRQLRQANDAIPDEALSADIDRMERASADIFNYIAKHPEKAPQIRKFMSYYLPTTLKLLNSYEQLSRQSVKGENITSTMFNIAGMMHTVADAFEKQLDSLFTDEAMDISADITVFETMLKQEGFVEDKGTKLG